MLTRIPKHDGADKTNKQKQTKNIDFEIHNKLIAVPFPCKTHHAIESTLDVSTEIVLFASLQHNYSSSS